VGLTPKPAANVHQTTPYAPVVVNATGDGAGQMAVSQLGMTPVGQRRALTDLACYPPATDTWFAGADGRIGVKDILLLANPSDTAANVALSLWSSRGPLNPPGTSGITVPAHTAITRVISDLAPDQAGITVHVHANSGTVAASLLDEHTSGIRPVGVDWMPPTTPPATANVVTGYASGAAMDLLELGNPGDRDATVTLRVITPTKNFQPAGHQTVVVPAGHTVTVDLAASIAGEVAAVSATSDVPVVTEGMTLVRPSTGFSELAWMPAQRALKTPAGIAANVPPFGQQVSLVLTAPGSAEKVRVSVPRGASSTISVPAGRTISVDLAALLHAGGSGPGPVMITPLSGPGVYVERFLHASGAHGPLLGAEVPTVFTLPTTLPAVVPDLRAATP